MADLMVGGQTWTSIFLRVTVTFPQLGGARRDAARSFCGPLLSGGVRKDWYLPSCYEMTRVNVVVAVVVPEVPVTLMV